VLSIVAMALITPQPRSEPEAGQGRYAALLRNRRFLGFLVLIFAAATAMQVGMPLMPNFVVEVRGYDAGLVGLLGSANSIGVGAGAIETQALGSRIAARRMPRALKVQVAAGHHPDRIGRASRPTSPASYRAPRPRVGHQWHPTCMAVAAAKINTRKPRKRRLRSRRHSAPGRPPARCAAAA